MDPVLVSPKEMEHWGPLFEENLFKVLVPDAEMRPSFGNLVYKQ
jgi:hypothetical protein